jgi:hypothetical protein
MMETILSHAKDGQPAPVASSSAEVRPGCSRRQARPGMRRPCPGWCSCSLPGWGAPASTRPPPHACPRDNRAGGADTGTRSHGQPRLPDPRIRHRGTGTPAGVRVHHPQGVCSETPPASRPHQRWRGACKTPCRRLCRAAAGRHASPRVAAAGATQWGRRVRLTASGADTSAAHAAPAPAPPLTGASGACAACGRGAPWRPQPTPACSVFASVTVSHTRAPGPPARPPTRALLARPPAPRSSFPPRALARRRRAWRRTPSRMWLTCWSMQT